MDYCRINPQPILGGRDLGKIILGGRDLGKIILEGRDLGKNWFSAAVI